MTNILQDLRYGFRVLLKSPGFTALAVIALALGIGANTAVFSVAIAFLRKPIALPNLDRMVMVLRESEGLSVDEVAAIMGWSEAKVKIRAFRARQFMRKHAESILSQAQGRLVT